MRLINCQTLAFEEFYQPEKLQYAILSHRWSHEEVSYKDMLGDHDLLVDKKGFKKVKASSALALRKKMSHIWIDTCCINKESSAELSEAINSMFVWYAASKACYVYLNDFDYASTRMLLNVSVAETLKKCEWFYRGWTLQELIAPEKVVFYDRNWKHFDNRENLASMLSKITGIPQTVLQKGVALPDHSDIYTRRISERMSWAGKRQCTRVEDNAYSLLGLFDINMPMLYGEGSKAFKRLQEEIIRQTNDHSVFLWNMSAESKSSMLAPDPNSFCTKWKVASPAYDTNKSFVITNSGLEISLPADPWLPDIYLALLNFYVSGEDLPYKAARPGIFVTRNKSSGIFERVVLAGQAFGFLPYGMPESFGRQQLSMVIDLKEKHDWKAPSYHYGFVLGAVKIVSIPWKKEAFLEYTASSRFGKYTTEEPTISLPAGHAGTVGVLEIAPSEYDLVQFIKLGFDFDFQPVCVLKMSRNWTALSQIGRSMFGNANIVSGNVVEKHFFDINCLEEQGWDTCSTAQASHITSNMICLKPPKSAAPQLSFGLWARIRQSKHVTRDWRDWKDSDKYRGWYWELDVRFSPMPHKSSGLLIWRFDLTCTRIDTNGEPFSA